MKYHDGKYFSWHIENPLKTYNKVKKYWKRPKMHIRFGKSYKTGGYPISDNSCAKILHIDSFDVGWKDKYNSPRHEYDPIVSITLFNTWRLLIFWRFYLNKCSDYNMAYWESILDYLYYNLETPEKAVDNNVWKHYNSPNKDDYILTPVRQFLYGTNG